MRLIGLGSLVLLLASCTLESPTQVIIIQGSCETVVDTNNSQSDEPESGKNIDEIAADDCILED